MSPTVTPEVTGYLVPTLLAVGEADLAIDLALWEASVQRRDGSFAAPDGVPYTFDTAQVARGFLAVLDRVPALETNLRHDASDGDDFLGQGTFSRRRWW